MNTPLTQFLSTLTEGPVDDPRDLEPLLVSEWGRFRGSGSGGMCASKLKNRMENVVWKPPVLTFTIERHGAAFNGSTRAELQDWSVDVSNETASFDSTRKRQLIPAAKRLDVAPIAEKIADAIVNDRESESLKRYSNGSVKVLIGTLIDGSNQQTIATRRKRFRTALDALLSTKGWTALKFNTYTRKQALPTDV